MVNNTLCVNTRDKRTCLTQFLSINKHIPLVPTVTTVIKSPLINTGSEFGHFCCALTHKLSRRLNDNLRFMGCPDTLIEHASPPIRYCLFLGVRSLCMFGCWLILQCKDDIMTNLFIYSWPGCFYAIAPLWPVTAQSSFMASSTVSGQTDHWVKGNILASLTAGTEWSVQTAPKE